MLFSKKFSLLFMFLVNPLFGQGVFHTVSGIPLATLMLKLDKSSRENRPIWGTNPKVQYGEEAYPEAQEIVNSILKEMEWSNKNNQIPLISVYKTNKLNVIYSEYDYIFLNSTFFEKLNNSEKKFLLTFLVKQRQQFYQSSLRNFPLLFAFKKTYKTSLSFTYAAIIGNLLNKDEVIGVLGALKSLRASLQINLLKFDISLFDFVNKNMLLGTVVGFVIFNLVRNKVFTVLDGIDKKTVFNQTLYLLNNVDPKINWSDIYKNQFEYLNSTAFNKTTFIEYMVRFL